MKVNYRLGNNNAEGWLEKTRKCGKNEFFPNVGIVNYGSKSRCFDRGVSKWFVLSGVMRFFEGSFFRGEKQWLVVGGQWSVAAGQRQEEIFGCRFFRFPRFLDLDVPDRIGC
jgi:hypothetical protein